MVKIAMSSWETLHSHAVGGIAAHVTELATALERRGHEVHVFTRPGYRYWASDLWTDYGRELCRRLEVILTHDF